VRRTLPTLLLAAVTLQLAAATGSAAPAYLEIRNGHGQLVAAAQGATYSYPQTAPIIRIAAATQRSDAIQLDGVWLLAGRVQATRIVVPDHGLATSITGLVVDNAPYPATPNSVIPLPGVGYLVADQQVTDGTTTASVGLRVHVTTATPGLAAGSDLLVAPTGARVNQQAGAQAALSVLGLSLIPGGFGWSGYVNPIGPGLVYAGADEGTDWAGTGTVNAIGNGIVTDVATGSGWPGGGLVTYQLTSGPDAGDYIYVAEHIIPTVHTGQLVTPGQSVAYALGGYPYLETGYAASPDGETSAVAAGDQPTNPPHETAFGLAFAAFLRSLGAAA
jgi:hypothetical protein